MAFKKYTSKNLAQGSLATGIAAGSGSLTLKTGEGALFPSAYPFLLKIEKIVTLAVTKREIVECTNRSGDTFTITRSADYCPLDDTALTQTNTAGAFDADDIVSLVLAGAAFEDQQTEIARLETDKLNKTIGNWKIVYSNGSGVITELALPAAGKVLTGNGTTSAPTFEVPTVDINGLTEVSTLSENDMVIVYDSSVGANRKYQAEKLRHYYGSGGDGAVSGGVTITGSNNTYILKQYTTFVPGSNTITITPTNCVLHIKVQGDCDLTNTTFNFSGKGGTGGAGAYHDNYPSGIGQAGRFGRTGGGTSLAVNLTGAQTSKGTVPSTAIALTEAIYSKLGFIVSPGAGGSGGSCNNTSGNSAAAGGAGGGAVILEVGGNLILSSTTMTFTGAVGVNAVNDNSGGGGGGGGGSLLVIYQGTLTGTVTPTVTGGAGGTCKTNSSGGGGGSSAVADGTSGDGTTGGTGGAGEYMIINQKLIN